MDVKLFFSGIMARIGFLPSEKPVLTGMAELEAQAVAVRNAARGRVSPRDREALLAAEETLEGMAKLRNTILSGVTQADPASLSDTVGDELARLLNLPTGE